MRSLKRLKTVKASLSSSSLAFWARRLASSKKPSK